MSYDQALITREDGSQVLIEVWPGEIIIAERPNKHATWGPPMSGDRVTVMSHSEGMTAMDEYERLIEGWLEERRRLRGITAEQRLRDVTQSVTDEMVKGREGS